MERQTDRVCGVLERSSLLVRLRALAPRLRLALLMKEERVSLGLQPGSATDAALERPGTLSSRSWQPISLTSSVPGGGATQVITGWGSSQQTLSNIFLCWLTFRDITLIQPGPRLTFPTGVPPLFAPLCRSIGLSFVTSHPAVYVHLKR